MFVVVNVQLGPEIVVLDANIRQLRLIFGLEDIECGHGMHVLHTFVEVVEKCGFTGELAEKEDSLAVVAKKHLPICRITNLEDNFR